MILDLLKAHLQREHVNYTIHDLGEIHAIEVKAYGVLLLDKDPRKQPKWKEWKKEINRVIFPDIPLLDRILQYAKNWELSCFLTKNETFHTVHFNTIEFEIGWDVIENTDKDLWLHMKARMQRQLLA